MDEPMFVSVSVMHRTTGAVHTLPPIRITDGQDGMQGSASVIRHALDLLLSDWPNCFGPMRHYAIVNFHVQTYMT